MTKYALQARWVLPIETPPIAGGVVTIEGERITAVGTRAESGAKLHDLGDVVLLPGLVNAHTHLEFSLLTKPLGQAGMSLPAWIQLVIASRKQPSDTASGVAAGLRESLRSGVTSLGEISTADSAVNGPAWQRQQRPDLIMFHEVIGFSAARTESVFAALKLRLQVERGGYGQGISPHAPYTVHPDLLKRITALAGQLELPVAIHLAESREELQLLRENAGPFRDLLEARSMWDSTVFAAGLQPIDYLQVLAQAPRALVVHGNYLSTREIAFVAERCEQMSIIYCPRTHHYFGHAAYPLRQLLAAGVQVAVGTDSRASNPDLSLLSELRFVAQAHQDVSLQQVLSLGTLSGAKALGIAARVGSLVPGKLANLTAIACDPATREPLAAVLCGDAQPRQTWLRGGAAKID